MIKEVVDEVRETSEVSNVVSVEFVSNTWNIVVSVEFVANL